jgi:tetratricopeptide (TPR) repeat protein
MKNGEIVAVEQSDEEKEQNSLNKLSKKAIRLKKKRQHEENRLAEKQANADTRWKNYPPYVQTTDYYRTRLATNPTMSRYTHFLAALSDARGDSDAADKYYRQTITLAPHDIMARNDFALHLNAHDRKNDAIHELKKATLIKDDNSILQKNLGAVYGRRGHFTEAMHHATQARFLAPSDAMNYRNLAKLEAAMGDTHAALEHNLKSIELEDPARGYKPNTSAYRAAAVQIIARGGSRAEALSLMTAARQIEGKKTELSTTERTYEIINKIKQQQGDRFRLMEQKKEEARQQSMASTEEWRKLLAGMSTL